MTKGDALLQRLVNEGRKVSYIAGVKGDILEWH